MKLLSLFNFLSQGDPVNPNDGDFWRNSTRLKVRNGTTTEQVAYLSDLSSTTTVLHRLYQFSFIGFANNVPNAPFGKISTDGGSNPSTNLPSTKSANSGLADATIDPYLVINNCTARRVRITVGQATVQQTTLGTAPVIRVSLWKAGMTGTRTLIGNFDIPLTIQAGAIGTNVTLNNVLATGISPTLSLALSGGDCIGLQFDQMTTTNNWISGAGRMVAVLETEE